jgi:actin-like ATPase involved in cell morphogenesis
VFGLFSCDLAIDLGTVNTLVWERGFVAGGNHDVIVGRRRMT